MKKVLLVFMSFMLLCAMASCGQPDVGPQGPKGDDGLNGKSAYDLAVEAGFEGNVSEWLLTLVGEKGDIGASVSDISMTATDGLVDTYTITFSDGSMESFTVTNGIDGINGSDGMDGANGKDGAGISSITLTASEGNVDTYTITLDNGKTETFTVTNGYKGDKGDKGETGSTGEKGKSAYEIAVDEGFEGDVKSWLLSLVGEKGDLGAEVSSVLKTDTLGLVDTYTIVFSNGAVSTFTVTNANGISKIEKTASSGLTDIYTITMNDGTTYPFTVTNGAKGDKGDTGATGPKGDKGDTGATGPKGDTGNDGRTVEFRVDDGWLQWKYTDEDNSAWKNLYETDGAPAPLGLVYVRFVSNGGSIDGAAETVYVTSGTSIELPIPSKHGYTFLGWYESESDEYAVPNTYRVHDSTRLYAKWEAGAVITGTKIYNINDLVKIKNNLSGTYVLMNNIDCDGMALPLIGESSSAAFRGIFEGQGYTISNYTISPNQYMGLFGYNTGTIRNLNVSNFKFSVANANTSSSVYIGGIVGYNAGVIEKCGAIDGDISVNVTNERRAALIAGESTGEIRNCFARGTIYIDQPSNNTNWALAGGITATNRGKILNSYVDATLYAYGYKDTYGTDNYGEAGLICATNESSGVINNCFVLGTVLEGNHRVGDIAGRSDGTISNCYKDADCNIAQNSSTIYTYATAQSLSNLSKYNFYSVSLGWESSVWNYYYVDIANGIYPSLNQ